MLISPTTHSVIGLPQQAQDSAASVGVGAVCPDAAVAGGPQLPIWAQPDRSSEQAPLGSIDDRSRGLFSPTDALTRALAGLRSQHYLLAGQNQRPSGHVAVAGPGGHMFAPGHGAGFGPAGGAPIGNGGGSQAIPPEFDLHLFISRREYENGRCLLMRNLRTIPSLCRLVAASNFLPMIASHQHHLQTQHHHMSSSSLQSQHLQQPLGHHHIHAHHVAQSAPNHLQLPVQPVNAYSGASVAGQVGSGLVRQRHRASVSHPSPGLPQSP
ncbi:unnamed protein product [Protopolystoma xenopodis]|uniref:Uncharacterized protein n=1 Tax=Protopolystoma xenopodis TaxID=117903 RepID=A0A3S5AZ44_9PLAT|nr:unnamed protein product [Protopolystoma xenopodis]